MAAPGLDLWSANPLQDPLVLLAQTCLEQPDRPASLQQLTALAHGRTLSNQTPGLSETLAALLLHPGLDPDIFGPLAASWLPSVPLFAQVVDDPEHAPLHLRDMARHPVFLNLLGESLVVAPWLERLCWRLRRELFRIPETDHRDLRVALARQALRSQYAWPLTSSDRALAGRARARAAATIRACTPGLSMEAAVADAAHWLPLAELDESQELLETEASWSPGFSRLIDEALKDPREEARLRDGLATWGAPETKVSARVAAQYESYPYPRWSRPGAVSVKPLARHLTQLFPKANARIREWPARPRVLVAGAGTGAEPVRLALAHPECEIVGIDLSRTSLAVAQRRAHELDLKNLVLAQADLLTWPDDGIRFELIECVGVLHHLADPRAGAERLMARLAPGGILKLGLYSRAARKAIMEAREIATELGVDDSQEGLREFRGRVLRGSPSRFDPLMQTRDFYSLSGVKDLCFHEHETTYDPLEVQALLDSLGLELMGLTHHDPGVFRTFRAMHPRSGTERDLSCWHRFEQAYPDTFAGMYLLYAQRPGLRCV